MICIIGNIDRHAGNLLIDLNERWPSSTDPNSHSTPYLGKIWAIDHSRAFPRLRTMNARFCRLDSLGFKAISLGFMQRLRKWQITDVEAELRAAGHSEKQIKNLHLRAVDSRAQRVKEHIEAEQLNRAMSDEEFYSAGEWHQVW